MNDVQPLTARLLETFPLGRDHLGARIHLPAQWRFAAGQWVNLVLTGDEGTPERRALSMASSPAQLPHAELCVRRRPDSLAVRFLEAAAGGAEIELEGPYGAFQWDPTTVGPVLMVASSAGIAPLRAMLQDASQGRPFGADALLLHAVAADRDLPYGTEADEWQQRWPGLRVVHFNLGPDGDESRTETWEPVLRAVQHQVMQWRDYRSTLRAYLAGHGSLVKPLRRFLREDWELERRQVKTETFWP